MPGPVSDPFPRRSEGARGRNPAVGPESPQELLLYVHVPFCRSKCRYCAFHSQRYDPAAMAGYLKTLPLEAAFWRERLGRPKVRTVYFGGGTPSLLTPSQLAAVLAALHRNFDIAPAAEITVEANPDSALDVNWFRALLSLGVNRLSLGVQSLTDAWLKQLGRRHSAAQAVESYSLARRAGFANISLDFIWGLPGQTLRQWLKQLRCVTELEPEHLSCYGLTVEPDTPLAADTAAGLELPPEYEQARMFVSGAKYLEALGWLQYEISNFSRKGYASRHNQGYWEGCDYLGLGPSAVSTLGNRRYTNHRALATYAAAVRRGTLTETPEILDDRTRLEEMVMLSLRTARGLDLEAHQRRAGFDLLKTQAPFIRALHQNRLIRLQDGRLCLTKEGMAVSTVIMQRLALG